MFYLVAEIVLVCIIVVSGDSKWIIERHRTGDHLQTIPNQYKCSNISGAHSDFRSQCRCSRGTPTFMLFKNGTIGCFKSIDICQGCNKLSATKYDLKNDTLTLEMLAKIDCNGKAERAIRYYKEFQWIIVDTGQDVNITTGSQLVPVTNTLYNELKGRFIMIDYRCLDAFSFGKNTSVFIKMNGTVEITDTFNLNTTMPSSTNSLTTEVITTTQSPINESTTNISITSISETLTTKRPANVTSHMVSEKMNVKTMPTITNNLTILPTSNSTSAGNITKTKNPPESTTLTPGKTTNGTLIKPPLYSNITRSTTTTSTTGGTTTASTNEVTTTTTTTATTTSTTATTTTITSSTTTTTTTTTTSSTTTTAPKTTTTATTTTTTSSTTTPTSSTIITTTAPKTTTTTKVISTTFKNSSEHPPINETGLNQTTTMSPTKNISITASPRNRTSSKPPEPTNKTTINSPKRNAHNSTLPTTTTARSKDPPEAANKTTTTPTNATTNNQSTNNNLPPATTTSSTSNHMNINRLRNENNNENKENGSLVIQVAVPLAVLLCLTLLIIALLLRHKFKRKARKKREFRPNDRQQSSNPDNALETGNIYEYASSNEVKATIQNGLGGSRRIEGTPVLPEVYLEKRISQKSDTSDYESLQLQNEPASVYHPLNTNDFAKGGRNQNHMEPMYFETEPIYSDATSPFNNVKIPEPLYHETEPESDKKSNTNRKTPSKPPRMESMRETERPPSTTLHHQTRTHSETPPPVPNSRRPSNAILNPSPNDKYGTEV